MPDSVSSPFSPRAIVKSTRSCRTAPGLRHHAPVRRQQRVGAIPQHDAAKARVGHDQVGAAADHHGRHAALARRRMAAMNASTLSVSA